jgi:hypothetical protein
VKSRKLAQSGPPSARCRIHPWEDRTVTEYSPLTRPFFIYIDQNALHRPEVKAFADFYLSFAMRFLPQVGYVPLTEDRYRLRLDEIDWRSIE